MASVVPDGGHGKDPRGPSEIEVGRRLYGQALERWLLEGLDVVAGDTVLELASGYGALCLRLAELVRPGGRVICSDLSPDRVVAIRRRLSGAEGIDVRILDMLALDVPDASVDGVLCRWGLMFPLPTEQALAEAARVLRPGRRLVLAVWAEPDRNPWITLVDDALLATGQPIPADRRWPGRMFSLANPRRLRTMMVRVGFADSVVDEVPLVWEYDDFEAYWDEEALIPGPFEEYIRGLPPTGLSVLRARLRSSMARYRVPDGGYALPGVTLVAKGRRS